jgi:predicted transcriptional regulator
MTPASTTIRVSVAQRERLRRLADQRESSMADTLDDAIEALRRDQFYRDMATSEATLRAKPAEWAAYVADRDAWLNPDHA